MTGISIGQPYGQSEIYSTPSQVLQQQNRNQTHRSSDHQSLPQSLRTHQERFNDQKPQKIQKITRKKLTLFGQGLNLGRTRNTYGFLPPYFHLSQ